MDRGPRFEAEALPHLRSLYATAWRLTRNVHDAEDLVQETLLRAFRSFDRFQEGTNVRAWLFTILHHLRTDQARRLRRQPPPTPLEEAPEASQPAGQDRQAGVREVREAIERLPEVFRAAVLLRDVEEFSYEEISRILAVPLGTVMSRIHRGRALLRASLVGDTP